MPVGKCKECGEEKNLMASGLCPQCMQKRASIKKVQNRLKRAQEKKDKPAEQKPQESDKEEPQGAGKVITDILTPPAEKNTTGGGNNAVQVEEETEDEEEEEGKEINPLWAFLLLIPVAIIAIYIAMKQFNPFSESEN